MLICRIAQALQALETNKRFYETFGELSHDHRLNFARHAAKMLAVCEYEREAHADRDPAQQQLLTSVRSHLANSEHQLVKDFRFLGKGNIRTLEWVKAFIPRLKMAVFGGLIFLIPMMIMVLHPTKLTALLTTIICVLSVAVSLSFRSYARPIDILSATAAYAAVLVVFVGTSTKTSGLSDGVVGAISGGVLGGILLIGGIAFALFYKVWRMLESFSARDS
jgi:hypothetical protein